MMRNNHRLILTGLLRRTQRCCAVIAAAIVSSAAGAEEFIERADVVRVEPILSEVGGRRCNAPIPKSDDLMTLLRWDLCEDPAAREATAYRVFYRWDDRTYSRVMNRQPGPTVPIRVRFQ